MMKKMMEISGINVLSLFDGISCGQVALERCGIKVDRYYASEIDKYAIAVTQENYPDTIQIGDIKNIDIKSLSNIDLVYGGSPCQGFSFAGKQLNFEDPRSKLFFEFVRVINEIKPKYWLLENVKMKKEYQDIISEYLGVKPILINSNLLSSQNRPRLYWANFEIIQPKDKNILLKNIIQKEKVDKKYNIPKEKWINTLVEKDLLIGKTCIAYTERRTEEAKRIRKEYRGKYGKDFSPRRAKELIGRKDNKMNCLTATFSYKEHTIIDNYSIYRKLTPLEFERLQTLPDNYTAILPDNQRYKSIGNGWTVDVIVDIFNQMIKK